MHRVYGYSNNQEKQCKASCPNYSLNPSRTKQVKPPLGLTPSNIWKELRLQDIDQAIGRYIASNMEIPNEWLEEYFDLKSRLKPLRE